MSLWDQISQHITAATGETFQIKNQQAAGGGCINQTTKVSDGKVSYFVKTNSIEHGDMFAAEAEALQEMAQTHTIKVPQPVCYGDDGASCFLVLEFLNLHGTPNMSLLGEQFAAMHRISHDRFGWHRNNTIGSTPQINDWHSDWIEFWREHRLAYQLRLARQNGYGGELQSLGEKLLADMHLFFEGYSPQPSMLHGDLWGGNAAGLADGTPVIYDPAFYYGDREADLAMTHLFGGFGQAFYAAYGEAWPLDAGYPVRKTFYNLYHIINHLNIFGGGYHGQALSMLEQLLAELK
ncbi:MAG: fructosamine kinase family protein [Gammaproteobacteria bacterium]|nr:fructosamine kinase family protein [Gammaproteobacteria bacterium]